MAKWKLQYSLTPNPLRTPVWVDCVTEPIFETEEEAQKLADTRTLAWHPTWQWRAVPEDQKDMYQNVIAAQELDHWRFFFR